MKASSFAYLRAQSLDEALAALSECGGGARILAGGQSLIPAMNMRLATPEMLIDIAGVSDLQGIRVQEGMLRIGAMVRHAEMLKSSAIAEHAPLIAKAMPHIAHPAIRNCGTFGGSLCMADPAAELPACALALGARFNIQRRSGIRTVAAADFFQGTYTTCLADDEILISVDVPLATPEIVTYFDEVARRQGDYAMAGLAAKASSRDRRLDGARLAFFAVSDRAAFAPSAERLLNGSPVTAIDADAVCKAVADDITPLDDLTTSGKAKLVLMQTLTRRALASFASQGVAS